MATTGRNIVIAIPYTKLLHKRYETVKVVMELFRLSRQELDPHDLEFDSDEGLEAILRRELIEIVCANGLRDPETLRSVLTNLPPSQQKA